LSIALLALIAAPAGAGVIKAGSDLWRTTGDGSTHVDFGADPLPAGFFCAGSAPFAGNIVFQGVPLVTSPAGVLGETDTIVARLDDAVLDAGGAGLTRVRVIALSFAAREPVVTSCGVFDVTASLAGPQPETSMRITRTGKDGGTFSAPISVVVRTVFTPRKGGTPIELVRRLDFIAHPEARWSYPAGFALERGGSVLVDTDGDRRPDTYAAGTSNFVAGVGLDVHPATGETSPAVVPIGHCADPTCTKEHGTLPTFPSPQPQIPNVEN
jgi:hypothetical protein